jgi:hypothetical protein
VVMNSRPFRSVSYICSKINFMTKNANPLCCSSTLTLLLGGLRASTLPLYCPPPLYGCLWLCTALYGPLQPLRSSTPLWPSIPLQPSAPPHHGPLPLNGLLALRHLCCPLSPLGPSVPPLRPSVPLVPFLFLRPPVPSKGHVFSHCFAK